MDTKRLFVRLILLFNIAAFTAIVVVRAPLGVLIMAPMVSWVPRQLAARAMEGRWLSPKGRQYAAFNYGDGLLLPAVAICLSILREGMSTSGWYDSGWWIIGAFVPVILLALYHRLTDNQKYTRGKMNSPSKLWHDLSSLPAMAYLVVLRMPAISNVSHPNWVPLAIGITASVTLFAAVVFPRIPDAEAYQDYNWKASET